MHNMDDLRQRINDLFGALLQERLKQCQQSPADVEAVKTNGHSTTREESSSSIAVRSASNGKQRSIGRKS